MVKDAIRNRIIAGEFPPGSRLPTLRDLSRQLALSPVTLQKATNQLAREGFLKPMGSQGTFVSENPPHLCRYALAFPSRPNTPAYWTNWWTTLQQAAVTVTRSQPSKEIVFYYDTTGHTDVEDYRRLLDDVQARRLAGVILLSAPHLLPNSPLIEADCPVPRVYLGCDLWKWHMPGITLDFRSLIDRAFEHAVAQSRRRPMMLCGDVGMDLMWPIWSDACYRHGIEPERWQLMAAPVSSTIGPRHLTQVLMMLPPERRPDTLILTDDNLVEAVTAGLLAANLRESEMPLVISHCNYPNKPRHLLPVTFLGYNSVSVIRAAVEVLDAQREGRLKSRIDALALQRQGLAPAGPTIIPAVFDSELPADGEDPFGDQPSSARVVAANEKVAPHPSYFELAAQ